MAGSRSLSERGGRGDPRAGLRAPHAATLGARRNAAVIARFRNVPTAVAGLTVRACRRAVGVALLAAALAGAAGCALPFQRTIQPPVGGQVFVPPPTPDARREGSLWRPEATNAFEFTDDTAVRAGDLLTVLVTEDDSGTKSASTATESESEVLESIEQFFGLPQQLAAKNPDINPAALVKTGSKRAWDGEGSTSRRGQLTARVTVEVKAVSPTGNLWVAGQKQVSVDHEDQYLIVAGWVRPADINAYNEVESTRLAEAQIHYYGYGPLGRQTRQPWGIAVLDWVWPF